MEEYSIPHAGDLVDIWWDRQQSSFRATLGKRLSRKLFTFNVNYHDGNRHTDNLNEVYWRHVSISHDGRKPSDWFEPGDIAELDRDRMQDSFVTRGAVTCPSKKCTRTRRSSAVYTWNVDLKEITKSGAARNESSNKGYSRSIIDDKVVDSGVYHQWRPTVVHGTIEILENLQLRSDSSSSVCIGKYADNDGADNGQHAVDYVATASAEVISSTTLCAKDAWNDSGDTDSTESWSFPSQNHGANTVHDRQELPKEEWLDIVNESSSRDERVSVLKKKKKRLMPLL